MKVPFGIAAPGKDVIRAVSDVFSLGANNPRKGEG
jgi:hypothetical protein